jgi:hypothetical protein
MMMERAFLVLAVCLLMGCLNGASRVSTGGLRPMAVYSTGSSYAGDGINFRFYENGHWESWSLNCQGSKRLAKGAFVRSGDCLTLSQADRVYAVFYSFSQGEEELLVDQTDYEVLRRGGNLDGRRVLVRE